ncbi:MAG: hypothetical protein D6708_03820 [Candidatus Dadabacteria bacterium]|nr:MAG: hypothetical protein D6708_03820 [Candidatus Dadabacteria bacterium]
MGATDLLVAGVLVYAFAAALRHGLRGRGEARAAGWVTAFLLVPAVAVIQAHGRGLLGSGPFSAPERWWVLPIHGPDGTLAGRVNLVVLALVFALLYLTAAALVTGLAWWREHTKAGPLQAIHRGLLKWAVVGTGTLLYLRISGLNITPFLFGMGAASIVAGLALQDPLANLFSGVAIDMEGTVRQGDWVRIEHDGPTVGRVIDKGWRSTRLLTLENELVTVPNRVLTSGKIVNYHRPAARHAHRIRVGASYQAAPGKVKEVLRSVTLSDPRVLRSPAPEARVVAYGDSSVEYEIRFFLDDYGQHRRVADQILTHVWYAFRANGIEIPFPIRTVHLKDRAERDDEQARVDRHTETVASFLAELPYFASHLQPTEIDELAQDAIAQAFRPGEVIVERGSAGDTLYVVRRGTCEVRLPGRPPKELRVGEYFGEMALLHGGTRNADVAAGPEGAEVLRIGREPLVRLFRTRPGLRNEFERTRETRLQDAAPAAPAPVAPPPFAARLRRAIRRALLPW